MLRFILSVLAALSLAASPVVASATMAGCNMDGMAPMAQMDCEHMDQHGPAPNADHKAKSCADACAAACMAGMVLPGEVSAPVPAMRSARMSIASARASPSHLPAGLDRPPKPSV